MSDKKEYVMYQLKIPKGLHTKLLHIKADTGDDLQTQVIAYIEENLRITFYKKKE